MEIVGEKYYKGFRFLECRCACGGRTFFAAAEDVESGEVKSCGHSLASSDIRSLFAKRYPLPSPRPSRPPEFRQLWLNPAWNEPYGVFRPEWNTRYTQPLLFP